jgi:hypothetical protein
VRAYATISREHRDGGSDLASLLHRGEHVIRAQAHLHGFVTTLVAEAAERGQVRDDIPAAELAAYALHAVTAASNATSQGALDRLVTVTVDGLRPAPTA